MRQDPLHYVELVALEIANKLNVSPPTSLRRYFDMVRKFEVTRTCPKFEESTRSWRIDIYRYERKWFELTLSDEIMNNSGRPFDKIFKGDL